MIGFDGKDRTNQRNNLQGKIVEEISCKGNKGTFLIPRLTSRAKIQLVDVDGFDQRPTKAHTLQLFGKKVRKGKTKPRAKSGRMLREVGGRGTRFGGRTTGRIRFHGWEFFVGEGGGAGSSQVLVFLGFDHRNTKIYINRRRCDMRV